MQTKGELKTLIRERYRCALNRCALKPREFRPVRYMALWGSGVPSDHQPAGTMNTLIGSGAPWN